MSARLKRHDGWGGARRQTEAQRAALGLSDAQRAALDRGRAEWATERQRTKAEGMIAARLWRAEHRSVAATGHMPFHGHRTCADSGERWCAECKQLRSEPCGYALCALADAR